MKIGILTFINTTNYGASLQAYALQEVIKSFGYDAEVIQYTNKYIENKEKNNLDRINVKDLIKKILIGNKLQNKIKQFKKFESEKINFSPLFDDLEEIEKRYDKIVVGSDQVWNFYITNNDWTFFLDFIKDNSKKIAYAPSFGNVEFKKENYEIAKNNLEKFKAISIREESGARFLEKRLKIKAEIVADPTLLLSSAEWDKKINFKPTIKDYILVYFPNDKKKVFKFAKKIGKKYNLPIVYLSISPKKVFGVKTIYDASPEEFIGWIKNASYIISGSFHGTVFSLNYNKEFFYENTGNGSRINSIVNLTKTQDRNIENEQFKKMNYETINNELRKIREKSKKWLKEALEK